MQRYLRSDSYSLLGYTLSRTELKKRLPRWFTYLLFPRPDRPFHILTQSTMQPSCPQKEDRTNGFFNSIVTTYSNNYVPLPSIIMMVYPILTQTNMKEIKE